MRHASGYSGKPLVEKLGIQAGFRISLIDVPPYYLSMLGRLPPGVQRVSARAKGLDFIHVFARDRQRLIHAFPRAKARIRPDGILWVSWPKKTSPLSSDLDETAVRDIGLSQGLVDVKVAAIDDDWSGLKFVYRLKDRR